MRRDPFFNSSKMSIHKFSRDPQIPKFSLAPHLTPTAATSTAARTENGHRKSGIPPFGVTERASE